MLTQCPECELPVSDKAIACPHCGYPIQPSAAKRKSRNKNNKRRRLPNGFGQISEIKGRNLRKPFRVMITTGKDSTGRPICKPLKPEAYFSTYNEAYEALVAYNRNPYDLDSIITMRELFDKWFPEYEKKVVESATMKSAWLYCASIYDMKVVDVRARHLKGCLEEGTAMMRGKVKRASPAMQYKLKIMLNLMMDYAVEYELVDRNYARTFKLSDDVSRDVASVEREHLPFTDEEMELIWANLGNKVGIDLLLIQCYSGWRPKELGLLEVANVDLENWTFKGGTKTAAGINRVVPIHTRIRPFVLARYQEAKELGSPYLFNWASPGRHDKTTTQLTYERYKKIFALIRDELGLDPNHRPHDGRKHFVTMAKKYNVDEYAIKYMVGHRISDITEKVYTKRELKWFQDEIEKIK